MRGSRNFRQGWGVQVNRTKKALTTCFFLSSASFTEVKWLISKKTIIFQGSRGGGVQHFPEGVQLFAGGSNCLFPIETHITCDFPGGGGSGPPVPPLWIRTCLAWAKGDRKEFLSQCKISDIQCARKLCPPFKYSTLIKVN